MNCFHCNRKVEGQAEIIGSAVLHPTCKRSWQSSLIGRKFACPECDAKGQVDDKSRPIKDCVPVPDPICAFGGCRCRVRCIRGELVVVGYKKRPCDLCEGYGYTESEANVRKVTLTIE